MDSAVLEGIKVLDLSRVVAGPVCTMTLADLGADVVKVERPGAGDDTRRWGPPYLGDQASYFLALNRNKRSLTLDFKDERGKQIVRKLAREADVVVENYKAGTLDRLGLGLRGAAQGQPRADLGVDHRLRAERSQQGPAWLRLRHPGTRRPDEHHRRARRAADERGRAHRRHHRCVQRGHLGAGGTAGARPDGQGTALRDLAAGHSGGVVDQPGEQLPDGRRHAPPVGQPPPQHHTLRVVPRQGHVVQHRGGQRRPVPSPLRGAGRRRTAGRPSLRHQPGPGREPRDPPPSADRVLRGPDGAGVGRHLLPTSASRAGPSTPSPRSSPTSRCWPGAWSSKCRTRRPAPSRWWAARSDCTTLPSRTAGIPRSWGSTPTKCSANSAMIPTRSRLSARRGWCKG